MKWTSEPPTEPGWYLYRKLPEFNADIYGHIIKFFHIHRSRGGRLTTMSMPAAGLRENELDGYGFNVTSEFYKGGEWAGPIPEPEE